MNIHAFLGGFFWQFVSFVLTKTRLSIKFTLCFWEELYEIGYIIL